MKAKFSQVIPGQIFWGEPSSGGEERRYIKILSVTNFLSRGQVNAIPYRNSNNEISDEYFSPDDNVEISEILGPTQQNWI